ncbi:MAG: SDR family oxidoreductase [Pseudomonadota bacterium]
MKRLEGRVAVITGAASGIGRELGVQLAKEGCDLALADINEKGLMETAQVVSPLGRKVSTHFIDVSHRMSMEEFPEEVMAEHGRVHLLINNAGAAVIDTFENGGLDDFTWLMDVNFWGVVYGCKFFLPYLREGDDAHIVNISSLFGLIGIPGQVGYCSSKFAVRGFTEALRAELAGTRVSVSVVHPGGVRTNIVRNARFHKSFHGWTREDNIRKFDEKFAPTKASEAAAKIIKGVKKNSGRIIVGRDAWMLDQIIRTFPLRVQSVLRWMTNR